MKTQHYVRLLAVIAIWGILMPQTLFSEEEHFVHRAPRDTVLWVSPEKGIGRMNLPETVIEGPGERLGLIGPIIARGGQGKKAYIAVYDPAGVLVGAITQKEVKANPERLKAIILVASKRASIQNHYGLLSTLLKAKQQTSPATGTRNK